MFLKPAAVVAAVIWAGPLLAQDLPDIKIAVLKFGTVNWELDTIERNALDHDHGFDLDVMGVASGSAGEIAFQAGEVDAIVSDWLWVARQRAAGHDYVFLPYSKAVGGLMVAGDNPAQTLQDLDGGKIGVAGGPLDKSWLILQAYAESEYGMNLQTATEQVFGAPPLMYKMAVDGKLDGAVNYWHYMAKMEAGGMRELVSVAHASEALGLDPDTPLLGYVLNGSMVRDQPDLVEGLAGASRAAKDLLMESDEEWNKLRDRMNAESDAEFEALKAGFRAGIPAPGPVDEVAANRMLGLMAELGGSDLVGDVTELPEGLFVQPGS